MGDYQQQLELKIVRLGDLFLHHKTPELEVFPSVPKHYRMRAEFRVWHEGDELNYVMYDQETKARYHVHEFPAASRQINELMPKLIGKLKLSVELRRRLFQVDFLSTLSGELLVSLLYHRQLDEGWVELIKQLRAELAEEGLNFHVVGRARKQKFLVDQDYVTECLQVNGRNIAYQQVENSFTQPNGKVAEKMLEWAFDCTLNSEGDLLELYCGNGNFSIALAPNFRQVLATEVSKSSVLSAQTNIAQNNADNVKVLRLSAEEFTQALEGVREFNRLKNSGVNLAEYDCQTVLVDPPRAGMDTATTLMVQKYEKIVYISCNPETLLDNLTVLSETHNIERFALFDQFPYTSHMEVGVCLVRK